MMEWLHILAASLGDDPFASEQISDVLKENGFEQAGERARRLHPLPKKISGWLRQQQELLAKYDETEFASDQYIEGQIFAYSKVLDAIDSSLYESFDVVLRQLRLQTADAQLGEMEFGQDDGSFVERLEPWTVDPRVTPNLYRTLVKFRLEGHIHRARVHVDFFEGSVEVFECDWQLEES